MFNSIWRFLRTMGYLLTGQIDKLSEGQSKKPAVIAATFDSITQEKTKRLNEYVLAVGGLVAQLSKKKKTLENITEETIRTEKLKQGALAKAKSTAVKYRENVEGLKSDQDYIKCQAAFRDFSSTLEEKNKRINDLTVEVGTVSKQIADHKVQIETLMRDLDKVKSEKYETLSDITAATEKKKISDMFNGLSQDTTNQELQRLRDLRMQVNAEASVSSELSGLDAKRSENEFLAYATENVFDDEFDKLIGVAKSKEATESKPVESKINEN